MGTRNGYTRVFRRPEIKEEMLDLRRQGYSYSELARKYGCDHTSIIHQCILAGIALTGNIRNQVSSLIKRGISPEEVAERFGISSTVVELYSYRKSLSQANPKLEHIARIPPEIVEPVAKPEKTILTRMDERGVEWRRIGQDDWVCMGRTEKQYKKDEIERRRRELEAKRIEMLTY